MELNDANFTKEKGVLSSIDSELTTRLEKISETVSGMSNYWHDSKSDQLINDVTLMLSNLSTEKSKVIESGEAMLDGVASTLNSLYK